MNGEEKTFEIPVPSSWAPDVLFVPETLRFREDRAALLAEIEAIERKWEALKSEVGIRISELKKERA